MTTDEEILEDRFPWTIKNIEPVQRKCFTREDILISMKLAREDVLNPSEQQIRDISRHSGETMMNIRAVLKAVRAEGERPDKNKKALEGK